MFPGLCVPLVGCSLGHVPGVVCPLGSLGHVPGVVCPLGSLGHVPGVVYPLGSLGHVPGVVCPLGWVFPWLCVPLVGCSLGHVPGVVCPLGWGVFPRACSQGCVLSCVCSQGQLFHVTMVQPLE